MYWVWVQLTHNHSQCCFYKGQTRPHMIYNSQKSCLPRGDEWTPMPLKLRGLYHLNYRADVCLPPCVICHHLSSCNSVDNLRSATFKDKELWLFWTSTLRQSLLVGQKKSPDKDNNGENDTGKKASVTQVPQAGCYAVCQCRSVFLRGCGQTA